MQQTGRKIAETMPISVSTARQPAQLVLTGRTKRLPAFCIDMALLWSLPVAVGIPLLMMDDGSGRMPWPLQLLSWVPGLWLLAVIAWQLRALSRSAQTLGKRIIGIHIVRSNGMMPDFWPLIGRRYGLPALICCIPLVGWLFWFVDRLAIFFNPQQQCLHDRFADTLVVRA